MTFQSSEGNMQSSIST